MTNAIIAVHAVAASLVILLSPVQVLRRRKDARHRLMGRSWVVCMYLVCLSGMFIYTLSGGFTAFHALAIFTLFATTLGVIQVRRGNVRGHVRCMVGSYLGALVAGGFAVALPNRFLPRLAVADPMVLWGAGGGVAALATAWVAYVLTQVPARSPVRTRGR